LISFLPLSSVSDVGQWCNRSAEDCRTLGNWKPELTLCTSGAVGNKKITKKTIKQFSLLDNLWTITGCRKVFYFPDTQIFNLMPSDMADISIYYLPLYPFKKKNLPLPTIWIRCGLRLNLCTMLNYTSNVNLKYCVFC